MNFIIQMTKSNSCKMRSSSHGTEELLGETFNRSSGKAIQDEPMLKHVEPYVFVAW